jgi:hypothetical protein
MIQHLVQRSTTFIPSPSHYERIKDVLESRIINEKNVV